jgi:hypothetical protein
VGDSVAVGSARGRARTENGRVRDLVERAQAGDRTALEVQRRLYENVVGPRVS